MAALNLHNDKGNLAYCASVVLVGIIIIILLSVGTKANVFYFLLQ